MMLLPGPELLSLQAVHCEPATRDNLGTGINRLPSNMLLWHQVPPSTWNPELDILLSECFYLSLPKWYRGLTLFFFLNLFFLKQDIRLKPCHPLIEQPGAATQEATAHAHLPPFPGETAIHISLLLRGTANS